MNILKDEFEFTTGNVMYTAVRINKKQFNVIWDGEEKGVNYDEESIIDYLSEGSWKAIDMSNSEEKFVKYFNDIRLEEKLNLKQSKKLLQKALQELRKDSRFPLTITTQEKEWDVTNEK